MRASRNGAAVRSPAETDGVPVRRGGGREWNAIVFPRLRDNSSSLSAVSRSASFGAETHTTLQRSPGSGTNTQGPCGGVKLGGDISMRPRMADVEGQRRLVEIAAADRDAGGFAAGRLPAVGADHQPCGQGGPAGRADGRRSASRVRPHRPHRRTGSGWQVRLRVASSAAISSAVLDVIAELRRGRFPRAKTSPRAHGSAGRYRRPGASSAAAPPGPRSAARPPDRSRKSTSRAEQGRGAVVGIGHAAGNQGGTGAGLRQRDRRRKSGGSAADHDDIDRGLMYRSYRDN